MRMDDQGVPRTLEEDINRIWQAHGFQVIMEEVTATEGDEDASTWTVRAMPAEHRLNRDHLRTEMEKVAKLFGRYYCGDITLKFLIIQLQRVPQASLANTSTRTSP